MCSICPLSATSATVPDLRLMKLHVLANYDVWCELAQPRPRIGLVLHYLDYRLIGEKQDSGRMPVVQVRMLHPMTGCVRCVCAHACGGEGEACDAHPTKRIRLPPYSAQHNPAYSRIEEQNRAMLINLTVSVHLTVP